MPPGCTPTFAQLLSRHGARYPTTPKSVAYAALIRKIQSKTTGYGKQYAFLRDYTYDLGADDLTAFGRSQLVDSGTKFYRRYLELARESNPFVRAAGLDRVIASAEMFINGFHDSKRNDPSSNDGHIRPKLRSQASITLWTMGSASVSRTTTDFPRSRGGLQTLLFLPSAQE
jgi:3-phytase